LRLYRAGGVALSMWAVAIDKRCKRPFFLKHSEGRVHKSKGYRRPPQIKRWSDRAEAQRIADKLNARTDHIQPLKDFASPRLLTKRSRWYPQRYQVGVEAAKNGLPPWSCPYRHPKAREAWMDGYRNCQK